MTIEKDELLEGLQTLGCGVQREGGAVFVSLPDDFAEFVLDWQGDWLYLGTTFLTPEEFGDSEFTGRLDRFLLELQDRSLGCHFAYDRNGFLMLGSELHRNHLAEPRDVLASMEQIAYVLEACLPYCDEVLQTGQIPLDAEMDRAFGTNAKLH